MGELIQIRSVKQYFHDFIVEGLKHCTNPKPGDLAMIKSQILDTFRKEIFEQISDKLGKEITAADKDDLADLVPVQNILKNSFRKWRRLCILCGEAGLGSYFQLEDLQKVLDDEAESEQAPDGTAGVVIPEDEGEDVTEEIGEEQPVYLNNTEEEATGA